MSAGIEVKAGLFADFLLGIARGYHFDANLGRTVETGLVTQFCPATGGHPGNIDGPNTVARRNRTFSHHLPRWHELLEQGSNFTLEAAMTRGWWGTHNDAAMAIRFDAAFDFPQLGIGKHFRPTPQVEGGLFFARSKLHRQVWQSTMKIAHERLLRQRSGLRGCTPCL